MPLIGPMEDPGLSGAAAGSHTGHGRMTEIIPGIESGSVCSLRTPLDMLHY